MSIINVFNSEKELFESYPKTKYFSLKDIFNEYWYNFLEFAENRNLDIRDVVKADVERMMDCKTPRLGYSTYKCPECDNTITVFNTCKSRFCNSCVLNMPNKGLFLLNLNLSPVLIAI